MSDHRDKPTESFKDRWNAIIDAWVPWPLFGFIIVAAVDSARGLADGVDGLVDYLGLLIIIMAVAIAAMFARIWLIRRGRRHGDGDDRCTREAAGDRDLRAVLDSLEREVTTLREARTRYRQLWLLAMTTIRRAWDLHQPWYDIDGVRHDHTVMLDPFDIPADHVCRVGRSDACIPEYDEHHDLACAECRSTTEDGGPAYPLWPCPTVAALAGLGGEADA